MSQQTVQRDNTSLADLDPDQLDASDELYQMAESMRDDNLFELPIIDWQRKHDGSGVELTLVTPTGTETTVTLAWPDKPTTDSKFIKTCMCALDVDDAQSAALMADELQNVEHGEYTVPATKNGTKWVLKPDAELSDKHLSTDSRTADSSASNLGKTFGFLCGPLTILFGIAFGISHAHSNGSDDYFRHGESGADLIFFPQMLWYGLVGTAFWTAMLIFLL